MATLPADALSLQQHSPHHAFMKPPELRDHPLGKMPFCRSFVRPTRSADSVRHETKNGKRPRRS
eukprot:1364587-Prorocentrum_lima.AAC.1